MLESMVEWMGYPLYYAFDGADAAAARRCRARDHLSLRPVPGRRRQDRDAGPAERARVGGVLRAGAARGPSSRPTSASHRTRGARRARDALRAIIVEAFAALTAEQVVARLDEAQIANARMNDMHDVWKHPQLAARERWTEVGTPAGAIPALLPPGDADAFAPRMDAVPALGTATDAILRRARLERPTDRARCASQARSELEAPRTLTRRAALALAAAVALTPPFASAQAYPSKPITLIVPFAAGGPTDVVARMIGAAMTQTLNQTVVIENKTGAGGTLAAAHVARPRRTATRF